MRPFTLYLLVLLSMPATGAARGFQFFEPVEPPRPFQVVSRGGQCLQAPGNTRAALARAIEDRLEWAEVDVRLSRDGHHILAQDARLERCTDGSGALKDRTLEELQQLDAGSSFARRYAGERLLSLEECMKLAKGKLNLCLQLKDVNPEQLAREILQAGMEKQVIVRGDVETLVRLREAAGGKVAILAAWQPGDGAEARFDRLEPAAVEIQAGDLRPEVVAAFHDRGIKVRASTLGDVDKPESWDRALAAGADWILTDFPEELLAHALWRRVSRWPVRIAFHRGAERYAPENTLSAFAKAIRMGADFIEFDVRATSDGRYYLLHGSHLEGTTDGRGAIAEVPSAEVEKLSAGSWFAPAFAGEKVPSLDALLEAVSGKAELYFDAKAIPPEDLAAALARHRLEERTVVYQEPEYLLRLKAIDRRIRLLPPLSNPGELEALAKSLEPYAVDASWEILSRELIERCHALGIKVFSDALGTHETIEDYQKAMDWGIDLIQTGHPVLLMRAIELREGAGGRPPKR